MIEGKGIFRGLKGKMLGWFLAVSLVPIAVVGYMSYSSGKATMEKELQDGHIATAQSRELVVLHYIRNMVKQTQGFTMDDYLTSTLEKIYQQGADSAKLAEELSNNLAVEKKGTDDSIAEVTIINLEGRVVADTEKIALGVDKTSKDYFIEGKKGVYIKDAYLSSETKENVIDVALPLKHHNTGEPMGVLVVKHHLDVLNNLLTDRTGLGATGESYLVNKDGLMITDSRFIKDVFLKQRVDTEPVKLFQSQKKTMSGIYKDYRGIPVIGASMGDELDNEFHLGWTLLMETDYAEAILPVNALGMRIMWAGIGIGLIIVLIAYFVSKGLADPVNRLSLVAARVAEGDLTQEVVESGSQDEVGALSRSFKKMLESLRGVVSQVLIASERVSTASQQLSSSSEEINATTQEVSSTVQQIAKGAEATAQKVDETSKVMEQMSASIGQVATSGQQAAAASTQSNESAKRGGEAVNQTVSKMNKIYTVVGESSSTVKKLGERSDEISKIVEVISNIADQTNLLALNAAIEAARAGEAGRGFAVVAEEVRKLAEGSAKAAEEITSLIKNVSKETSSAVKAMEDGYREVDEGRAIVAKAGEALSQILKAAENTATMVEQISAATQQMSAGSKQVVKAIDEIASTAEEAASATEQASASTEEMTASMQEMTASSAELAQMAIGLRELVGKFKVPAVAEAKEFKAQIKEPQKAQTKTAEKFKDKKKA